MSDESEAQEHGAGAGPENRDVNWTEAKRRHPRRERRPPGGARRRGSARLVTKKNAVVVICSSRPMAQNATHHEATHATTSAAYSCGAHVAG